MSHAAALIPAIVYLDFISCYEGRWMNYQNGELTCVSPY